MRYTFMKSMFCCMGAALLVGMSVYSYNKHETLVKDIDNAIEECVVEIPYVNPIAITTEYDINDTLPVDLTVGMETEITALAKLMYGEARGVESVTEQACVVWTVLNRVDAGQGTIMEVITKPYQFHYITSNPTVDDYGRDLEELAKDILTRWLRENNGETDVGRVLPKEYIYFHGDGDHNWFRTQYKDYSNPWNYSLGSPYES